MYGIFTYIWLIFMVNVGKYTIHGSYGKCIPLGCPWKLSNYFVSWFITYLCDVSNLLIQGWNNPFTKYQQDIPVTILTDPGWSFSDFHPQERRATTRPTKNTKHVTLFWFKIQKSPKKNMVFFHGFILNKKNNISKLMVNGYIINLNINQYIKTFNQPPDPQKPTEFTRKKLQGLSTTPVGHRGALRSGILNFHRPRPTSWGHSFAFLHPPERWKTTDCSFRVMKFPIQLYGNYSKL